MATSRKPSTKKSAAKKPAASKSSKVRSSKAVSPALAAFSNGLADAVARGEKLGSPAADRAAKKAASKFGAPGLSELVKLLEPRHGGQAAMVADEVFRVHGGLDATRAAILAGNKREAKMLAAKPVAMRKKKSRAKNSNAPVVVTAVPTITVADQGMAAAVNELKGRVVGGEKDLREQYAYARRSLARLCKFSKPVQVAHSGRPFVDPANEVAFNETDIRLILHEYDVRMHRILKNQGWLPQQVLARRKVEAHLMKLIKERQTGAKYGPVDGLKSQLARLQANVPPARNEWIRALGWWEGAKKNDHTFHTGKRRPSKDARTEKHDPSASGKRAHGAGSKDKMWEGPSDDRGPTHSTVCDVPNCGNAVRSAKPFESRGVKGMEGADGKIVCFSHFNMLVAIGRSSQEPIAKKEIVSSLIDLGVEPDEKMFAVANDEERPVKRQAPIRAHAVRSVSPTVVHAITAADQVLSVRGNGNGNAPVSEPKACAFCGEPVNVKKWAFKTPDKVRTELRELAEGRAVCKDCGGALHHLGTGKVPTDKQPVDGAGLMYWVEEVRRFKAEYSKTRGQLQTVGVKVSAEPFAEEPAHTGTAAEKELAPA